MRTRTRIHPYVVPALARRLSAYCGAKGRTESAVVEAALTEYFEAGEKDNALILRRLDRLGRRTTRLERSLEVLSESFSIYIHLWFAHNPSLPPEEHAAAGRQSEQRYGHFVAAVADRISSRMTFTSEVLKGGADADDQDTAVGNHPADEER